VPAQAYFWSAPSRCWSCRPRSRCHSTRCRWRWSAVMRLRPDGDCLDRACARPFGADLYAWVSC